jgi:hypothetical protein
VGFPPPVILQIRYAPWHFTRSPCSCTTRGCLFTGVGLERGEGGEACHLFCACEFPKLDGELNCHRRRVINLLFANEKKTSKKISIIDWPGAEPTEPMIKVNGKLFSAVMNGRKSIPFNSDRLQEYAGLPRGP